MLDSPQSPAYVTTDLNPGLTFTFPSLFPSGLSPDEELGAGTTLTVEVTASNDSGSSGPLSATVQPEFTPPPTTGLTTLYPGTSGNQSIVTGIDLVNNDGLVWIKKRTQGSDQFLFDTLRGPLETLYSNGTNPSQTINDTLTAFNDNGFDLGTQIATNITNQNFVAWTFGKAAGYFDVVKYTGDGTEARSINHDLGTTPGCIITKGLADGAPWHVFHNSLENPDPTGTKYSMYLQLSESLPAWNSDAGTGSFPEWYGDDSVFKVDWRWPNNVLNQEYIAYLFAEDTPGLIKCGGESASGKVVTGFRPQWLLVKRTDVTGDWLILDDKRPADSPVSGYTIGNVLKANLANAESSYGFFEFLDDGFDQAAFNGPYIYVAIAAPPSARSLTEEELEEQKLKFLTYNNRKMVNCGQEAQANREYLQAILIDHGYTLPEITAAYVNPPDTATPIAISGYYPLYETEADANAAGNGTSHSHLFNSVTYYMPNGVTFYHGDYSDNSGGSSSGGGGGY
jgi:hypothetical protein